MTEDDKIENSIIPIGSTGLVRVGKSIEITRKIIKEQEERIINQLFPTVKIGNQEWMTKNLDVDCYANGDPIPQVQNPNEWVNLSIGAWCYNNNNPENGVKFGKLYNYYAISDPRGLAPKGFSVPTVEEYEILMNYLRSVDHNNIEYGINEYFQNFHNLNNDGKKFIIKFHASPGGYRGEKGSFGSVGLSGFWWTLKPSFSQDSLKALVVLSTDRDAGFLTFYEGAEINGFSVRCIKR